MERKNSLFSKIIKTFFAVALLLSFATSHLLAFSLNTPISIYSTSDAEGRDKISVTNIKNTNYINFYVDQSWWNNQSSSNKSKVDVFASALASEFEHNMYPKIKTIIPEVTSRINFNEKIEMIISPMTGGIQGYVRQEDFYSQSTHKNSNEGKIIYFNASNIVNPSMTNNILFAFFSHELMHILTFQEKNISRNVSEDTWMEELRAEYLAHFLGYNNSPNSYINFRLQQGVNIGDINIINWNNSANNYSLVNLFGIYLGQRYSPSIIFDTLKTHLVGIDSINYYLIKNGFQERFDEIYQDWTIANAINDCSVSPKYCYKDFNVKVNIPGNSFYLPVNSDSVLSISDVSSNYQAKYQKIIGGSDTIEITFENPSNNQYRRIPYILTKTDGSKKLDFFTFNGSTTAKIIIKDYKKTYSNVVIIPIFSGGKNSTSQLFKWNINSIKDTATPSTTIPSRPSETQDRKELIMKLQVQLIELLKQLLTMLRAQKGI